MSAVAALHRRDRTGKGAYIDVAGSDAVLATQWFFATYAWNDSRLSDRRGMSRGNGRSAKYAFYETSDKKYVLFCGIEEKFWRNFCRAVGREDLLASHDDAAPVDFAGGDDALAHELQDVFHTRTLAEWVQVALDHDIAMGPAHQLDDLREDPHLAARGIVVESEHPVAGPFTSVGWPGIVRDQPFEIGLPAPQLGEHTDSVLAELGFDDAALADLRERGVV
jgi:crotonobetainyl-CoA:carnitine CoA-transferase CaiB-like acyl-CoA transferase